VKNFGCLRFTFYAIFTCSPLWSEIHVISQPSSKQNVLLSTPYQNMWMDIYSLVNEDKRD